MVFTHIKSSLGDEKEVMDEDNHETMYSLFAYKMIPRGPPELGTEIRRIRCLVWQPIDEVILRCRHLGEVSIHLLKCLLAGKDILARSLKLQLAHAVFLCTRQNATRVVDVPDLSTDTL